jgi:hypothetical protein
MIKAVIARTYHGATATLGAIVIGDIALATLELPWKENKRNISCIPQGNYICQSYPSEHFGDVFELLNVPNRDAILIHPGNTYSDTEGCILVGTRILGIAIKDSRIAMNVLCEAINCEYFELTIYDL